MDPEVALLLKGHILRAMAPQNSWVSAWKGRKWWVLSWLDMWPSWYATNYDLKDPTLPALMPDDPGFRDSYEDVGAFPEVRSITGRISTLFLRRFAGCAAPLM